MKLLQWIKSLFTAPSYQDQLDSFIASKCPKSTADVEYWLRAYSQNQNGLTL
jgi:hypothetical protein